MLAIRCRLLRDTFEGAQPDDPGEPEWPPSWMRVFSALVAVADHDSTAELALLNRLERLPAPVIGANPLAQWMDPEMGTRRAAWVPQNALAVSGSASLVARSNGERTWARFVPRGLEVVYAWRGEPLAPAERDLLDALCRRVPYVGRSTSPVTLEVVEDLPEQLPTMEPRPPDAPGAPAGEPVHIVRVPFPGSLDALRLAYEQKMRGEPGDPWAIGKFVEYGFGRPEGEPEAIAGPYRDFVVFGLEGPQRDGRHAVEFSDLFRKAVMARMVREIPAVHGHGARGTVQCAFLALPFVGHRHSDGHIVGLAIAIPELPRADLQELWTAVGTVVGSGLGSRSLGQFQLRRYNGVELRRAPLALQPWRWLRESTAWVTVYPAVFDRYIKRPEELEEVVRVTVRNSGYPDPVAVTVSLRPFSGVVRGALDLQPGETIRPGHREGFRPYRHLILRFARPVRGPVVIGSMRHYGLGLCLPLETHTVEQLTEVGDGE
jgi:CRISPR-associated protein Csb2